MNQPTAPNESSLSGIPTPEALNAQHQAQGKTRLERWLEKAFIALLLCAPVLVLFELTHLHNTIGGDTLFWLAAAVGLIPGLVLALIVHLSCLFFGLSFSTLKQMPILFYLVNGLIGALLTSVAASYINRQWSDPTPKAVPYTVLAKGSHSHKGSRSYFFIVKGRQNREKIKVKFDLWNEVPESEVVRFITRPGYFGFPIVDDVERTMNHPTNE